MKTIVTNVPSDNFSHSFSFYIWRFSLFFSQSFDVLLCFSCWDDDRLEQFFSITKKSIFLFFKWEKTEIMKKRNEQNQTRLMTFSTLIVPFVIASLQTTTKTAHKEYSCKMNTLFFLAWNNETEKLKESTRISPNRPVIICIFFLSFSFSFWSHCRCIWCVWVSIIIICFSFLSSLT